MSHLPVHRLAPATLLALSLAACGGEPHVMGAEEDAHAWADLERADALPTAADVKVMAGSNDLADNKKAVIDAAKKHGASEDTIDILLAMGMAETNEMKACDRDATKDGMGLAKNYSAFNMNGDMLGRLGWSEAQGPDLNAQANVEAAVALLLKAVDTFTLEGLLCFHRGGSTALADRTSYGAQTYVTAIKLVAAYLKAHPQERTSSSRVGMYIQHV